MSLGNVIDHRTKKNRHTTDKLDVVFEPTSNRDPNVKDDPADSNLYSVDWKYGISFQEALDHVNSYKSKITVYLYDAGSDPIGVNTPLDKIED